VPRAFPSLVNNGRDQTKRIRRAACGHDNRPKWGRSECRLHIPTPPDKPPCRKVRPSDRQPWSRLSAEPRKAGHRRTIEFFSVFVAKPNRSKHAFGLRFKKPPADLPQVADSIGVGFDGNPAHKQMILERLSANPTDQKSVPEADHSAGEPPQKACTFASCERRHLSDKLRECLTRNEAMRR
jgi:hypothetical protein